MAEVEYLLDKLSHSNSKDARIKLRKVYQYFEILERIGPALVDDTICKKIDTKIWELRPFDLRITLSFLSNNRILLISWFYKKTRKTPKKEVVKANNKLNSYLKIASDTSR